MAVIISKGTLSEVAQNLSEKTPIGSVLRSKQWQEMPAQLRESAFFSAGVESVRALQEAQSGLEKILTGVRNPTHGGLEMNRAKWIEQVQATANQLGLRTTDPNKRGGMQDFGSERRLAEIYRQQISSAQNKAYWESGQDPDLLYDWPAQELVRVRSVRVPRDWPAIWSAAGGTLRDGKRMIALKTDPIWVKISRFGRPWPPFDYGSGMGLDEIDRDEAEELGLIKPGEVLEPIIDKHKEELAASVKGLKPEFQEALQTFFGPDQIEISAGTAKWRTLPEQEIKAIEDYSDVDYWEMNKELRSGKVSAATRRRTDRLNDFLASQPDHVGTVYRGTPDDYDLSIYRENVGKEIVEDAFVSTTDDPLEAFDGRVRFFITSKTGKKVDKVSSNPQESEVLFASGSKFKVLAFEEHGNEIKIWLDQL